MLLKQFLLKYKPLKLLCPAPLICTGDLENLLDPVSINLDPKQRDGEYK